MTTTEKINRPFAAGMTRRRVIATGAAALAAAGAGISRVSAQSDELIFATWGGPWEEAMRKAWFDPFTEKTGIAVRTISGPDYGRIRAMVTAGRTEWDLVEVNPDFQWIGARENLLEPLDFSVIDREPIMQSEGMITDYSVPEVTWSKTMVYNTSHFSDEHPTTWAEFWDLDRFPGTRMFYGKVTGGALEAALLADGVAPEALYPLDVERALSSLDKIADHIIWYETNAQSVSMMADERAVLACMSDGQATRAKTEGAPLELQRNQSFLDWTSFVVPRGAPNKANAMKFIAYAVSVEAQAAIANTFPYGPITPAAFDLIPDERAEMLPGRPNQEERFIVVDNKWWAENRDAASEEFNAWRLG